MDINYNITMDSENTLLKLADSINDVYQRFNGHDSKQITAPRLVLVGSQSSGKSSLVNKLIGLNLMPVGDNMVTRTPINIRLHHDNIDNIEIKLSKLQDTNIINVGSVTITQANMITGINEFRQRIMKLTNELTENEYSISNIPIFVDIYSNNNINFSFVDLPGLIAIACVDKGQSKTLISEIKELITQQISIPNTVVLTVVQSKTDLEIDIGLALIKEIQEINKDIRTIGVLTKPDLLDRDNLDMMNNIVSGNISKNVMMDEGYFIINNKCETYSKENEFFQSRFDNNKYIIKNKRFGIINLQTYLKKYMLNYIKKELPGIKNDMYELLKYYKNRNILLGTELDSNQSKLNYIVKIVNQLNTEIIKSLELYESESDAGSHIGKHINEYVNRITCMNPFSEKYISNEYLQGILQSFCGYHMSNSISIEQIIKKCMNNKNARLSVLLEPLTLECVDGICNVLNDMLNKIIGSDTIDNLNAYKTLKHIIISSIICDINTYRTEVLKEIIKYMETEDDFFWTADEEFIELMKTFSYTPTNFYKKEEGGTINEKTVSKFKISLDDDVKNKSDVSKVRNIISSYHKTILNNAKGHIVKIIIHGIVMNLEKNMSSNLLKILTEQQTINMTELFQENEETKKEREITLDSIKYLEEIIMIINSI